MITQKTKITHTFTLELTESEMLALDGMMGYGADEFLKVFYQYLGKHYLHPHEAGVRSLFSKVRSFNTPSKVKL